MVFSLFDVVVADDVMFILCVQTSILLANLCIHGILYIALQTNTPYILKCITAQRVKNYYIFLLLLFLRFPSLFCFAEHKTAYRKKNSVCVEVLMLSMEWINFLNSLEEKNRTVIENVAPINPNFHAIMKKKKKMKILMKTNLSIKLRFRHDPNWIINEQSQE